MHRKLIFGVLPLLLLAALLGGCRSDSERTLHILMYHDLVEEEAGEIGNWTTTTACFRRDLEWLRDNGYVSYLPSEIVSGVPLAERAVLITFDDGYASNFTLALPLLREYGMKAAVSVVCERVDRGAEGFLTWDMCREMAESGLIEFGSHTYDCHGGIQRLEGENGADYGRRVLDDIRRSIDVLRRQTGQEILLFAYPHGETEPWAQRFLEEYFAMTVTTQHGAADLSGGLYNQRRYNVSTVEPAETFLPPGYFG